MGLALLAGACGEPTGSNRQIVSLSVSPDSALEYISDSLLAMVVARDRQGNVAPLAGVAWSSRNENVATVSRSGWITAKHQGRTSIIASAGGLQDSLLIISRARGITTVAPAFDTLVSIGQRIQLQAQTADSAGPLPALYLWISRDPGVASVTQTGQIAARGDGATWVVAIEASGSRDSARVVVRQEVVAVRVTPGVISRPVARPQRFFATPLDSGGTAVPAMTVAWSSARPALATVDSNGSATAVAAGVDTIRARIAGVTGSAVLIIDPLPTLRFNLDTFELGVGQYASSFQLPVPQLIVDSLDPPEWFIADLAVADTSVAFAPDSLEDPVSHSVFTIGGRARGLTTLTATAAQYSPATAAIRVSSPRLLAGEGRVDTLAMNDTVSLRVYTADSLGNDHHLVNPVIITAASSDP
ncbi:MAG TPA: hypothetical protein VKP10_11095, partial [Gemmatimonadales bacterium]|nr:hypothetical protein [Gemmatimonadales bacterium]